jgi:hypothetical protein
LAKYSSKPAAIARSRSSGVRVGRHSRDRHVVPECGLERTDRAHHRVPVLGGHRDVGQHEVRDDFRLHIDGGSRAACLIMDDGEVEAGQTHPFGEDIDFHNFPARDVEPQ